MTMNSKPPTAHNSRVDPEKPVEATDAPPGDIEVPVGTEGDEVLAAKEVHDHNLHIGVYNGGQPPVDYTYVDAPENWALAKTRTIVYGGGHYEHVHTDKDGCWLFRSM